MISDFDKLPCSSRQDKMNKRMFNRNIPSQQLQPYLNARPVLTKYAIMPIIDFRKETTVPLIQRPSYNQEQVFNPGSNVGPWSGFSENINTESELRNQNYALQECTQATFIPESSSSLYNYTWQNNSRVPVQPFPDLFKTETFGPDNKNMHSNTIGFALFNNATRQQMLNVNMK
jgi:hypothetical protein